MTGADERRVAQLAADAGLRFASFAGDRRGERVDATAGRLVPEAIGRYAGVVPLREEGDTIVVALADPRLEDGVRLVQAVTGRPLDRVVATEHDLDALRRTLYGAPAASGAEARPPAEPPDSPPDTVVLDAPPESGVSTLGLRLGVLPGIATIVLALFLLQEWLWDEGRAPTNVGERLLAAAGYVWLVPILPATFAVAGLALYSKPRYGERQLRPIATLVCFRVVARGENAFRLRSTVANVRAELARLPLFPYAIEVVTDLPVDLGNGDDLTHFVVPRGYRTERGALFKARALQYALEESHLPEDAWIVHLDEESHVTPSLIAGVRDAVEEEERAGTHRIGQGAILYHRDLLERPFLTLADSIRTGDDLGRFYLQHRLGLTIFGLHGSWILVRNSVERAVGFDFGSAGSVTEDSFWALRQMEVGRRCRWVDGYVTEQAPRTVSDFVKQRRRWFVGLENVATDAPVRLRYRVPLALSTAAWSLSWIGILYLYVNLGAGFRVPTWVQATGNVAFATYIASYVVGLKINLENMPPLSPLRRAGLYVAQVALIPAFALLEAAGVLYGLVDRGKGFHVVRK